MQLSSPLTAPPGDRFAHVAAPHSGVLRQIFHPAVNLSVWKRPAQPTIARELRALGPMALPDRRLPTSAASFGGDIRTHLEQHGLNTVGFRHLHADLCGLAELYFSIAGGRDVQFRLFTTDRDDCRRFHVDRCHTRLLCTYQGPGTEWLTNEQVDRVAQSRCAPNEKIIRFGEPCRLDSFWVAIMKGDPGNSGQGLVHRSPPVEGTGQIRTLFCLDS